MYQVSDRESAVFRQSFMLKACLFATGCAGIVAEFTLSTLASYLMGNTTLQWTLVMSLMLFSMGLGSRWSRYLTDRLLDRFIAVEFLLSVLCASCAAASYFATAFVNHAGIVIYGYAMAIGALIGMEIPLVARLNESYEELRSNIASVLEKDYYGSLVGGLLFAFFALPKLGLTYTPVALGAVNFCVASILVWRYRGLLERRWQLMSAFWATAAGLAILGLMIRPIVLFGEQSRYRDRIVYEEQTPYQRIVMTTWKGHIWLYLNGSVQFSTYDEARYHEPLVHPAMQLAGSREQVLILGGGDGMAVREVLKYPDVAWVTLVDLDPAMTALGKTYPALVEANRGALLDDRVRILNQDAGRFLADSKTLYDVILVDLPDPKGPDLARLYSREFYRSCEKHLAKDGVMATQSSSPLHALKAFVCVNRTMASAGFAVVPYHNALPTMGEWGWNLGMKVAGETEETLKKRLMNVSFEEIETRFINREAMIGMLQFWKGMFDQASEVTVSTEVEPTVDGYYREAEWGW